MCDVIKSRDFVFRLQIFQSPADANIGHGAFARWILRQKSNYYCTHSATNANIKTTLSMGCGMAGKKTDYENEWKKK